MKRTVIALVMVLLVAGCQGNKKQTYTQSDLKEQPEVLDSDIDYIALYLRAHELDSIKNVAELTAKKSGTPMEPLPDSLAKMWNDFNSMMLLQKGEEAFAYYDSHRADFERYLRLDFISYGFTTRVYLPYKATKSTKEEYGKICIEELEKEMMKAEQSIMQQGYIPSHYESLLKELFYAYVNGGRNDDALAFCNGMLTFIADHYGDDSINYANMLANKANLCNNMGSSYSAVIAAKQAITIYDNIIKTAKGTAEEQAMAAEEKSKLEEKLKLWK